MAKGVERFRRYLMVTVAGAKVKAGVMSRLEAAEFLIKTECVSDVRINGNWSRPSVHWDLPQARLGDVIVDVGDALKDYDVVKLSTVDMSLLHRDAFTSVFVGFSSLLSGVASGTNREGHFVAVSLDMLDVLREEEPFKSSIVENLPYEADIDPPATKKRRLQNSKNVSWTKAVWEIVETELMEASQGLSFGRLSEQETQNVMLALAPYFQLEVRMALKSVSRLMAEGAEGVWTQEAVRGRTGGVRLDTAFGARYGNLDVNALDVANVEPQTVHEILKVMEEAVPLSVRVQQKIVDHYLRHVHDDVVNSDNSGMRQPSSRPAHSAAVISQMASDLAAVVSPPEPSTSSSSSSVISGHEPVEHMEPPMFGGRPE